MNRFSSPLNTKNMYTIIRLSSIIFMMTFILSSCDKDPVDACIDDPTCEYFRCKVNGEWWTPDCENGPLFGCRHTDVQYYKDSEIKPIYIYTSKESNTSGMNLYARNIQETDLKYKFDFQNQNDLPRFYEQKQNSVDRIRYLIDTSAVNYIIFSKIDTLSFILEGKFYFEGLDDGGNRKIISDGSFRQKYRF